MAFRAGSTQLFDSFDKYKPLERFEQFEQLDFEVLAFPEVQQLRAELVKLPVDSERAGQILKQLDKLQLNLKHYLILSVENRHQQKWKIYALHDAAHDGR